MFVYDTNIIGFVWYWNRTVTGHLYGTGIVLSLDICMVLESYCHWTFAFILSATAYILKVSRLYVTKIRVYNYFVE
jgi:hypothetical protein